jgi:outer membrane biosynthesis protein TonB
MRPGIIVSIIGHIGAVLMTLLVWETRDTIAPRAGQIVPIEIVDVALESNVRALAEELPEEVSPEEQTPAEAEGTEKREPGSVNGSPANLPRSGDSQSD